MSIAEFYIENGIDPSDPNHADKICALANDDPYDSDEDNHRDIISEVFGMVVGPTTLDEDSVMVTTHDYQETSFGLCRGYSNGRFKYSLSDVPDPSENELWASLCADDRWKYKPSNEKMCFCEVVDYDSAKDYWGEHATLKAVSAPVDMHCGALAPQ